MLNNYICIRSKCTFGKWEIVVLITILFIYPLNLNFYINLNTRATFKRILSLKASYLICGIVKEIYWCYWHKISKTDFSSYIYFKLTKLSKISYRGKY